MSDVENLFGADNSVPEEEAVVEPSASEPQPEAVEPEPVSEPEPVNPLTPPVIEAKPDPGFVPITVMLDEREKRQKLEAQLAQLQQQSKPEPQETPDPISDPEAFAAWQAEQVQRTALNTKLDISEELARDKHGDELVDKARDWAMDRFRQNPAFYQEVIGQRNPYGYVVKAFQKAQIAETVTPDDYQQFLAWKASQAAPPVAAPAVIPTPPQAPPPPRSLATAPSAGPTTAPKPDPTAEKLASMF